MLVTQLRAFYDDLQNEDYASPLAMVHSRFSTNTFPSWSKAHPQRLLLHNGEINTIRGNFDRMRAREETMRSPLLGEDMLRVLPVVRGRRLGLADAGQHAGISLHGRHAPAARGHGAFAGAVAGTGGNNAVARPLPLLFDDDGAVGRPRRHLYSDGDVVCASLDRNGLRPLRCALTDEGRLILSSEAGALFEENARIARRWRLTSGGILVANVKTGELLEKRRGQGALCRAISLRRMDAGHPAPSGHPRPRRSRRPRWATRSARACARPSDTRMKISRI